MLLRVAGLPSANVDYVKIDRVRRNLFAKYTMIKLVRVYLRK